MGKKLRLVLAMVLVLCMSTVFAACGSKTITGIAMDPDTMPSTTIGIDESFSIGEANKIIVTYDNGSTSKWSITESMVTYNPQPGSGNKWSKPQTVTVTVTFSRLGTTVETTFELHIVAEGEAGALVNEISALDLAQLTYADKGTVDALTARYNRLTDVEKSYVTNYDALVAAAEKIAALGEEVASIVLTAPVTTAYNVGDVMNWAGAYATITKVNGAMETVTLTAENATVTGFTTETEGEKTVTIAYEGETVEYKITVTDNANAEMQAAIAAYNAQVAKLPTADALQYTQVAQVNEARVAYDALVAKYGTDGKLDGVTDEAVKALEAKIESNNAAVKAIVDTFIAADDVKYSDKATIVKSRTDFDNIANGWTGYVTEEQKAVLTASEAVIVEMEKAIEQFRTLAAQLPAVADYSYEKYGELFEEVDGAFYDLILTTLKFDAPEDDNYAPLADKAGIRPEYDKIQAIWLCPDVLDSLNTLKDNIENGTVISPLTWQNATNYVEEYEAGNYPTDATLVEALEELKELVAQIEADMKALTDEIDKLFGIEAEANIMLLSEEKAEPTVYEAKKAEIDALDKALSESIYNKLFDAKYAQMMADAKKAYETADALIADVKEAIDGAAIVDSLTDVADVEALYKSLAELKVFGEGYTGALEETTAEAFFGVNLTSEVDRTSLDEKEVAFVQAIIDSISSPIKYEQVGLIEKARAEYDMLSEANQAKIVGMEEKLEAAETDIENYKTLAAEATAKIDAIPDPVTLDDAGKQAVTDARTVYEQLGPDGWKELVSAERLEKLMKAEQALEAMQDAVDEFLLTELPADADLKPGDYVATTEGDVTTYTGILGEILTGYNNLVKDHDEIAANASVAEFKAQLDALIAVVVAEDAKVVAFNKAVDEFVPNYDASTAALREQLAAIRANWKTTELIPGYVAAVEDDETTEDVNEAAPETTEKLEEFDAAIKAENDAIDAFLAVALPTVDGLTYEQYITEVTVGEITYANIFEQSKALYDLLAEYTTKNHEEVIARFELLTALFIDTPAQGVEGEEGYVPAVDSEITRLNKSVATVETMIDALSDTFNYAEKDAITEAYDAYKALEKGWIAAVAEEKAEKIEALYAAIATAEAAVEELKAQIEALPTPDDMLYSDLKAVEAARAAYNEIVLAENGIDATSIKTLVGAELCEKLAALEERVTKLTKTAQEIQAQIDAIDATTYASKADIEAARAAYDAFVTDGQGFHALINTANLVAAEKYIADCDEACAEFLQYVEENLPADAKDLKLEQVPNIATADGMWAELDADIQDNNEDVIAAKALIEACKDQDAANKKAVEDFVAGVEALPVTEVTNEDGTSKDPKEWNVDEIDITYEPTISELNDLLEELQNNGYVDLTKPETEPEEKYITQDILDKLAAATDKVNEITSKIQAILDKIEAIEKLDDTNTVVDYANAEAIMKIIVEEFDKLTDAEKATTIGQKIESYRTSINEMTKKAEDYIAADAAVVVDELNYTDASRNSVTDLRTAYDALVDGWNTYANETASVSEENLLAAEAKIAEFEAQLAAAEALVQAILDKNFVLEASAARAAETVIDYSNRAEIVAAKDAYDELNDVVGLQAAFDADLVAELNRVYAIVNELDAAVGTEIANEITAAFTPLYTKVTLDSKPTIDKFFIMIGELEETEEVKAFRNGWGAHLKVGYPTEYELLNKALARYEALVAGEETFKNMVHAATDGMNAEDVTYAMGETLNKIREYYKETFVTESDREKIRALPEYETLEAFESAWQLRYLAAQEVVAMIDEITYPLDAEKVAAAKAAYDEIEAEGYGFEEAITNYNKLLGYLDELEESYETPEAIENFLSNVDPEDWSSFATVDYGTIDNFLNKVLVNFKNLSEEDQAKISPENQAKLEPLETAANKLMADLEEIRAKLAAVNPAEVDLSDATSETGSVYLANEALKAVEPAEGDSDTAKANKATWKKALYPELENLEKANEKIAEIKAAMAEFIEAVENLPEKEKIDYDTADLVFNAEAQYNNLTPDAQADEDVQNAKAKLDEYLDYIKEKGFTSFAEAYKKAVDSFNTTYYNKSETKLDAFYLATVVLPDTFENLKVGGVTLADVEINVNVGKGNLISGKAFTIDENGRLNIALPVIATSLDNGRLEISYTAGGEVVTKVLTAYSVTVGTTLSLTDSKVVNAVTGYESEVTQRGASVAFSTQHGSTGIGLAVSANGTELSDGICAFYKMGSIGSTEVTYGFVVNSADGVTIYPEYSADAVSADTVDAKKYDIYLDGYGVITVTVSYTYYKKA